MFKIEHEPQQNRFIVNKVDDVSIEEKTAVLEYVLLDDNALGFTRTELT